MESIIKASVMFLLSFTMPAKTTDYSKKTEAAHCFCVKEQEATKTTQEPEGFWLASLLLIAE